MYEVWVNQLNPAIHLVKKQGSPMPDASPMVPWSLLGVSAVRADIAASVERDGVAEVIAVTPFDPAGVFGPSGAPSGASNNDPH